MKKHLHPGSPTGQLWPMCKKTQRPPPSSWFCAVHAVVHATRSSHRGSGFRLWRLMAAGTRVTRPADVEKCVPSLPERVRLRRGRMPQRTKLCEHLPGDTGGSWCRRRRASSTQDEGLQELVSRAAAPMQQAVQTRTLKAREQTRVFEEILPCEGELHDHAVSSPSVKIRVMPSSPFLPLQFFWRMGGALLE